MTAKAVAWRWRSHAGDYWSYSEYPHSSGSSEPLYVKADVSFGSPAMTPNRFRECLTLIGWSGHELARRLDKDERQIRRWASGAYAIPQPIADWLEKRARFHERNPPP